MPRHVDGWHLDFVSSQAAGNLERPVALQSHGVDAPYHVSGLVVHNPVFPLFVPEVAIGNKSGQVLSTHTLGLECLIINVVDQVLRHLDGLKLLDIHPPQLLLGVDVGIKIVAVQVLREIDQIFHAPGVLPTVHDGLKRRQLVLVQLRQQTGQMVQLVNTLVLAQVLVELGHRAVIRGNKNFLISIAYFCFLARPPLSPTQT